MSEERKLRLETLAVHAGQEIDPTTMSRAVPIYQTTSYGFRDTDHAADLFALKEMGNIYTRIMNPTTDVFETACRCDGRRCRRAGHSSGQAAITYSILNIAEAGDEIVSASSLYGGTYNLFAITLRNSASMSNFVDPSDPENFRKAITPKTKAIFAETIGNPHGDVLDIEAVAEIAHETAFRLSSTTRSRARIFCGRSSTVRISSCIPRRNSLADMVRRSAALLWTAATLTGRPAASSLG